MAHGAIEWVEIPARDLQESPRFYESVFGWKINRHAQWEQYPMFMDAADKLGGGFVRAEKPAPDGGVLLYISVDDIEAMLPAIEKQGGTKVKEKTLIDESVGWWASFRDPAGNVIGLYQKARKA
jgi:predicted enzyme related to lactoylglutathione lyase